MGILEDQARFLVAKYGTAAGPTGFAHVSQAAPSFTAANIMVLAGLVLLAAIVAFLLQDAIRTQRIREMELERVRAFERTTYGDSV